jgi:hypothetical protein
MKAKGRDPDALKKRPEVPVGYHELLTHFNRLSFSRSFGFGNPNPIAIHEIISYNQAIARLDLEFFVDVVQMLDTFYLENYGKKSSTQPDAAGKSK